MGVRRVEVEIQELVLHGFGPLDARALGDAVAAQLEGREPRDDPLAATIAAALEREIRLAT